MRSVFFHVWKFPILLAVFTLFGLLSALIGTGIWHIFSWIALLIPIAVCIRYGMLLPGKKQKRDVETPL